jgi:uncharacterized small protein (TIGR04563 family)
MIAVWRSTWRLVTTPRMDKVTPDAKSRGRVSRERTARHRATIRPRNRNPEALLDPKSTPRLQRETISTDPSLPLGEPRGWRTPMAGTDKRKQSLYFPEEMLREIQEEANRQDRSLSWIVQQAWKIARGEITRFPSVNDVIGGDSGRGGDRG